MNSPLKAVLGDQNRVELAASNRMRRGGSVMHARLRARATRARVCEGDPRSRGAGRRMTGEDTPPDLHTIEMSLSKLLIPLKSSASRVP